MTSLDPAPTIRQAKWELTLRLIDYLNRKWARAMSEGQHEIKLQFPTQLVVTINEALIHVMDHQAPLYRLHVDIEDHSREMLALAAEAGRAIASGREPPPSSVCLPFGC